MPIPVGMVDGTEEGAATTTVGVDGTVVHNTIAEDPMAVTVEVTTGEAEAGVAREFPMA
jgi:hypothetical protein